MNWFKKQKNIIFYSCVKAKIFKFSAWKFLYKYQSIAFIFHFHFLENLSISKNYHQIHSNFFVYLGMQRRANRFSSSLSSLFRRRVQLKHRPIDRKKLWPSCSSHPPEQCVKKSGWASTSSSSSSSYKLFNTIETELSDVTDGGNEGTVECSKIKPCSRSLFTWNNGDPLGKSAGDLLFTITSRVPR